MANKGYAEFWGVTGCVMGDVEMANGCQLISWKLHQFLEKD